MPELVQLPIGFWLSLAGLAGAGWLGWTHRQNGWGFPAAAVCLTVLVWYHGDAIYNGYSDTYSTAFPYSVLAAAWSQVLIFAVAFAGFVWLVPDWINGKHLRRRSSVAALVSGRRSLAPLQACIAEVAFATAAVWFVLFCLGLWRANWDLLGLLAPYLGHQEFAWARGQIAASWFDSIASLLGTLDIVCASLFGVCASLLRPGTARQLMFLLMAVSWPGHFLDRTRHAMLLILLPGILALTFIRLRGRTALQLALLLAAFAGVNVWFKFVIANRTNSTVLAAFRSKGMQLADGLADTRHLGLNMFEELCWINYLLDTREFNPATGHLYFSTLVNPIPRALWPGKPTIGLDYAIARGQAGDEATGTTASISTGMIGSGVVNFGKLPGPVAAAFLMSLWCAFLARLDLTGHDAGRLLVYLIGCVSIFNFGRDITLLVAYPTLFGFGLLWVYRRFWPLGLAAERKFELRRAAGRNRVGLGEQSARQRRTKQQGRVSKMERPFSNGLGCAKCQSQTPVTKHRSYHAEAISKRGPGQS